MAGHKPSVIDLERLMDQRIRVKSNGGREFSGVLKSYDVIPNIVLDDCIEHLRSEEDPYVVTDKTRDIGIFMIRGTSIVSVAPVSAISQISNPFVDE